MKDICLDFGMIQSFLDNELSHEQRGEVSSHMAECDACAFAFAEAEDEAAIVFPALDRELNTLVPTQRLWNKISDSIAVEKALMPWWKKAWALAAVALANPSLAIAASLIIVVGVFAAVWVNRAPVAIIENETVASKTISTTQAVPANVPSSPISDQVAPAARFERADFRPETRRLTAAPAVAGTRAGNSADPSAGEASYVNTISTLAKTVEDKKDGVLRPSQRVAYERDMAVVNDTIAKMKKEVKRNPRNETARQVLYSSYQNKIDLLNSVAQKEELMASIK